MSKHRCSIYGKEFRLRNVIQVFKSNFSNTGCQRNLMIENDQQIILVLYILYNSLEPQLNLASAFPKEVTQHR